MARTVTMIATMVSAPQWDFAVSLALLRPSAAAAAAEALALAEDTIFEIESGAWEVLGTMSEKQKWEVEMKIVHESSRNRLQVSEISEVYTRKGQIRKQLKF
jgi:hypothetical protein